MHKVPETPAADTAPLGHGGAAEDSLKIRKYVRIAYRRGWIAAVFLAAGLLIGKTLDSKAVPVYEAWATMQIEADPNVLGLDRPLVEVRDWMREFLPTQLAILRSRELAIMAREELKNTGLFEVPGTEQPSASDKASYDSTNTAPDNSTSTAPDASPTADPIAGSKRPLPSAGVITGGRRVSEMRNTRLVNIGFSSTDPFLAAEIANALARAYVRWSFEFKLNTTGAASDWLAEQVEEQRRRVQSAEAALQRYREQHGAEALRTLPTLGSAVAQDRQNIVVQKLAELQGQVTVARAQTIEKEAQYRLLSSLQTKGEPLDTLPIIASNGFIQALKGEVASLQHQLAQASEKLGERHPEIIRLQGAVQNAEEKLRTEISKAAAAIRNDYEATRAREAALAAALERQKGEVSDLNAKAVEYTALEGEARANRQLLDTLVQRSRQIALARDVPSANARILDAAEVPVEPISRTERTLSIAIVGSMALALGLIFLLEVFDTSMTSPEDVERYLRVPVLGVTPLVKRLNGRGMLFLSDGAPPRFAELLQGVRTSVVTAPELATSRALLVTSAEPGEGKSMSAANLAVSLARLRQRVLLIDADLRKPRLHQVFGAEQQPGLAEVLAGKATHSALRKTKISGLWLMPSGIATRNPADLLGSERFGVLVDCFAGQFDWVILDSPPVLAVTDASLIARVSSGVLLVVACGRTSRDVGRAAVERLDAVGAKIVGALLNRVALDRRTDSYLPYYHRSYDTYYSPEAAAWTPNVPDARPHSESAASATTPTTRG